MALIKEMIQNADWKAEKHVPVIELPAVAAKGERIEIAVSVGKHLPHPNTSAHHIAWLDIYFLPEGEKFACQLARVDFSAHGASLQGVDTGTVYTMPEARVFFKTDKPGIVMACCYCNIHGLWESSAKLSL